ncbi:short-chain fatty acyl-CoA regulator family protein [Sphingomonas sp. MMS24-JH45]
MPYGPFGAAARVAPRHRPAVAPLRRRRTGVPPPLHLQRSGAARCLFCRVDMAGNITKRHSATRLRHSIGGACPLSAHPRGGRDPRPHPRPACRDARWRPLRRWRRGW